MGMRLELLAFTLFLTWIEVGSILHGSTYESPRSFHRQSVDGCSCSEYKSVGLNPTNTHDTSLQIKLQTSPFCNLILDYSQVSSQEAMLPFELKKKRKLPCEHTDLGSGSPVSKQKRGNQLETELAESSENNVTSPFINHDHSTADPYMEPDWYCTSSSSYSNEATSSSTLGSSIEFNNSVRTDISVSEGIEYSCRKGFLNELKALGDPVINKLVKSSMVVCEDPYGDTLDSMLYSNGLDELSTLSASGGTMQDGGAGPRPLTIDQEFEQYFSKLML